MVNFEQKMRMPYAKSSFLKVHRGNVAKVIILARLSHFFEGSKMMACATLLGTQKMRQSEQNYDFWNVGPVDFQK